MLNNVYQEILRTMYTLTVKATFIVDTNHVVKRICNTIFQQVHNT